MYKRCLCKYLFINSRVSVITYHMYWFKWNTDYQKDSVLSLQIFGSCRLMLQHQCRFRVTNLSLSPSLLISNNSVSTTVVDNCIAQCKQIELNITDTMMIEKWLKTVANGSI